MTRTMRPPIAWLLAILVLAAIPRVIGLTFGLPAVYNPDEISIMSRALTFATGDLNPHNFLYPTFYFYVLFGWIGLSFVVSWMAGLVPSAAAFQTQFFTDPTNIYLAGRLLGVVCGVATVALTYGLGARLGGRYAGLAAALFLAAAPTHVRDSHYVKHDVPATLAIVVAQLAILRLLRDDRDDRAAADSPAAPAPARARTVALAGAACGVAFSTHYYAVFLALPLLLAICFREREHGGLARVVRTALLAAVVTLVVFFALSPFLLVEPLTAWRDIVANRQIVVDRAVEARHGVFASAGAYARMLWTEAIGWPVLLAAAAGAVWLARERWTLALVLFAFPLAFLAFISNTVAASRYLNPVLPTLAVLAGYAVARLAARMPAAPVVAVGLMAAMSLPGLLLSARIARFLGQTDTRTLAQQDIERDVPPGSTILVQPYSVQLTQSRDSLVEALTKHLGEPGRASTRFARRLALDPYPAPAYRTLFLGDGGLDVDKIYVSSRDVAGPGAIEVLRGAGVQYVVMKRYNVDDPASVPLLSQLEQRGRLVARISPYAAGTDGATKARVAPFLHNTDTPCDPALARPGPGIEVWQIR